MRLIWLGLILVAALAPVPGWAASYSRLAGMQDAFDGIPAAQRDKLLLIQRISHKDPSDHSPIQMWVTAGGTRVEIPVAPDGRVTVTPHPDWVAQGLAVETNQTPGTLQLQVEIGIVPPASGNVPVVYLEDAMTQAQGAIKVGARMAAGFLGALAAPSVTGVKIKLTKCCDEKLLVVGTGDAVGPKQSADGTVLLDRATLDAHPGASLKASAAIVSIEPDSN
jgi:hypothetical protein